MAEWIDRILYPRPTEERIYEKRVPVPNEPCPSCGSDEVCRYRIANYLGPRITITCQKCLHVLRVERPTLDDMWPPFRSLAYDWEPSPSERVGRTPRKSGNEEPDSERSGTSTDRD